METVPDLRHLRHCVTRPSGAHSTSSAAGWLIDLLDALGSGPSAGRVRQCPAHRDSAPSLSIADGEGGRALIYCHAGCSVRDVLAALNVPMARLFSPASMSAADYARLFNPGIRFPECDRSGSGGRGFAGYRLESVHEYGDGRWLLNRWRNPGSGKKQLVWETRTDRGTVLGLLGVPTSELPLYREREVRMAVGAGEPVLLVESESSVDALRGHYATTWAGGASAPPLGRLVNVLGRAQVVIIPDNDEAGLACLERLREALPHASVLMPGDGQDAADLYRAVDSKHFAELVSASHSRTTSRD